MTQISLSHQFSKRWLAAPQLVREAIVQELDDIVTLLESDNDDNDFTFTKPDLNQFVDSVYTSIAQEGAQKATDETLQSSSNTLPVDSGNNTISNNETLAESVGEDSANHGDSNSDPDTTIGKKISDKTNVTIESTIEPVPNNTTPPTAAQALDNQPKPNLDSNLETVPTQKSLPPDDSASTQQILSDASIADSANNDTKPVVATINEAFLKELEGRIDDYLTERLTDISEDLKSWLRDQVRQHNLKAFDK